MKKGLFIFFFVIGLAFLVGSFVSMQNSKAFMKTALSAEGEVLELITRRSSNGTGAGTSISYTPEVKFQTADGQDITFESSVGSNPPSYSQGEKVKVWYDPQDPYRARLDGFAGNYLVSVITGFMGLVFTAFGVLPLLYFARRKRLAERLKAHGQKIVGKISSVEKDGSITMNGKSPYRIYASGADSLAGNTSVFKSDMIWIDPSQWAQPGQSIDIYLDPQNHSKYYIDITFLPSLK